MTSPRASCRSSHYNNHVVLIYHHVNTFTFETGDYSNVYALNIEMTNRGCRCMRTWRLCFRKWIDPPNVLDGWMIPLTQAHVEQYAQDEKTRFCELIYFTRAAGYYVRAGNVSASGIDIADKFVYEQYTPGSQKYAAGCYGDCYMYRGDLYHELNRAIRSEGPVPAIQVPVACNHYDHLHMEMYLTFSEWRKQWLTRVYFLLHLRKVGAELWSWLPRDLLRWFIMQYVGADVWACFGCHRANAIVHTYNFALFPQLMQPSGRMGGQTAHEFMGDFVAYNT